MQRFQLSNLIHFGQFQIMSLSKSGERFLNDRTTDNKKAKYLKRFPRHKLIPEKCAQKMGTTYCQNADVSNYCQTETYTTMLSCKSLLD